MEFTLRTTNDFNNDDEIRLAVIISKHKRTQEMEEETIYENEETEKTVPEKQHKEAEEREEEQEEDEHDTTSSLEEYMEIDDGDLIVRKLESRKRALEEEEKKIQEEQDRLKIKHCKIQEELEELSYLL